MNTKTILVLAAIIAVLGAGIAVAIPGGFWDGMMGGYGTITGSHCGEAVTPSYGANAAPITIDEAKAAVEKYLAATGNDDLQLAEVLQFNNHFYAGIKEKSTNKYAFELLVNKYTGAVVPEMGPNMMWDTK